MAEPIKIPFGLSTQVGPSNCVLDGGPVLPMGRGHFFGKGASHCKVQGYSAVNCAKTAEPIEMSFVLSACMGPKNYALDKRCRSTMQRGSY